VSEIKIDVAQWAQQQFGECQLGDLRRTRRLLKLATQFAAHPDGSTPDQTEIWGDCKAAYRLLDEEDVTFTQLCTPHWQQTRARTSGVWLLIGDTTQIQFDLRRNISGLGPVGDDGGQGFLLHSSLMIDAQSEEIIGLAGQELFYRQPRTNKRESTCQRKKRARESEVWGRVIDRVGPAADGVRFIHVFDRGADSFEVYCHLRQQRCGWVVRAGQLHRLIQPPVGPKQSLQSYIDGQPILGRYPLKLRANNDHPPRTTIIAVQIGALRMPRPRFASPFEKQSGLESIPMYVVQLREFNPPPGVEPLHWVLLTSEPVRTFVDALGIIGYYEKRPVVEEYHKALKTGCRLEARQYRTAARLERVTAVLSIVAVRLLQLKSIARATPNRPAREVAPLRWIELLQLARHRPRDSEMTVREFIRELAKLGGFLGRKSDGEPGWITIWRGVTKLILIIRGSELPRRRCG